MTKINIIAPIGGFGNHIRWILLLDDQFRIIVKSGNDIYVNLAGINWPDYDNFINERYSNISKNIVDEIKLKCEINLFTSIEKINFIKKLIYPMQRSYHNWLNWEWRYRVSFNNYIQLDHEYSDSQKKTLILTIDPMLAYKCYVKFNSNLNNMLKDQFIQGIELANQSHSLLSKSNENIQLLDSTILYQPSLDYDWYQELISKLNLDNNYQSANIIHKLWYDGHKRSERDITHDMTMLFGSME